MPSSAPLQYMALQQHVTSLFCPMFILHWTGGTILQVTVEPDAGEAQQSSMSGLQSFLVAGVPQQLAVTARDAQGNLTAAADAVEVLLDSIPEGEVFIEPILPAQCRSRMSRQDNSKLDCSS